MAWVVGKSGKSYDEDTIKQWAVDNNVPYDNIKNDYRPETPRESFNRNALNTGKGIYNASMIPAALRLVTQKEPNGANTLGDIGSIALSGLLGLATGGRSYIGQLIGGAAMSGTGADVALSKFGKNAGQSYIDLTKPKADFMGNINNGIASAIDTSIENLPLVGALVLGGVKGIKNQDTIKSITGKDWNTITSNAAENIKNKIEQKRIEAGNDIDKALEPIKDLKAQGYPAKPLGLQAYDVIKQSIGNNEPVEYIKEGEEPVNKTIMPEEKNKLLKMAEHFKGADTLGALNDAKSAYGASIKSAFDPNRSNVANALKSKYYNDIKNVFLDNIPDEFLENKTDLENAWQRYGDIKTGMNILGIKKDLSGEYTTPNNFLEKILINKPKTMRALSLLSNDDTLKSAANSYIAHDNVLNSTKETPSGVADKIDTLNSQGTGNAIYGENWEKLNDIGEQLKPDTNLYPFKDYSEKGITGLIPIVKEHFPPVNSNLINNLVNGNAGIKVNLMKNVLPESVGAGVGAEQNQYEIQPKTTEKPKPQSLIPINLKQLPNPLDNNYLKNLEGYYTT